VSRAVNDGAKRALASLPPGADPLRVPNAAIGGPILAEHLYRYFRLNRPGRTILVSRHAGAVEWLRERVSGDVEVVDHLDPSVPVRGDVVIGVLPVGIIAELCSRGVKVGIIDVSLTPDKRGKELTSADLFALGARLVEVRAEVSEWKEL
jgi:CRISPR-associated protein Csx16